MIDWEDILEDVNWKRGLLIISGGIILIAAAVLVLLDYKHSTVMKANLEGDLSDLREFNQNYKAPSEKELNVLKKQQADWEAKLSAVKRLPTELDANTIAGTIKASAAKYGVSVQDVKIGGQTSDGNCLILPAAVVFSASSSPAAAKFIADLNQLPEPHIIKRSNEKQSLTGAMQIALEFYGFDQASWEANNNCDIKMQVPQSPTRNVDSIYLFKSQLTGLQNQVNQEQGNLKNLKPQFQKTCEIEIAIDRDKAECEILADKLSLTDLKCK
jgi:hypothetical protein